MFQTCPYGFSCASMMMQPSLDPSLDPAECPNRKACGAISGLPHYETIDLYAAEPDERGNPILTTIAIGSRTAALRLLGSRGRPQNLTSIGITDRLASLQATSTLLQETIELMADGYIAPAGVEAHRYSVKHPHQTYEYNKLTSDTAIFPPQREERPVRVIHLSKDHDWRNLEGRAGIERRNRLNAIATILDRAESLLQEAIDLAQQPSIAETVAAKIAPSTSLDTELNF